MKHEIVTILDNLRSRENVGSIFRTADAVGISKIYLCGITPTPEGQISKSEFLISKKILNTKYQIQNTDKIAKTALGAEKWVPWEYHKQTWRLIEKLKAEGWFIVALEKTPNSQDIFKTSIKSNKIALILGNEVSGLKSEIIKRADKTVGISMYGQKESLNVSVAFGIAIYHLIKN